MLAHFYTMFQFEEIRGGGKGVWHWEGLALLIGEMVCSEFFELLYGNSMFCAGFSYEAFVWIFERAKNVKLSVHA